MRVAAVTAAAALLLVACAGADPLPEPGAEGPIRIFIWQHGDDRASRMTADRIVVEDDGLQRYRMHGIALIRPLDAGLVVLDAAQGSLRLDDQERVHIEPPVLISGLLAGAPVIGRSQAVAIDAEDGSVVLHEPQLFWRTQAVTSQRLFLRQRDRYQAEGWHGRPGSAAMAATLGALPTADGL